MNDNANKIIVVLGQTASGKSGLALKLARKFNGQLVSADSRQIYKYMDIGTNKDMGEIHEDYYLVEGIPIYLFDRVEPDEEYSVAEYKNDSIKIIKKMHEQGKLPIMVGGTGFYIQAVVDNLDIPQVAPDKELREKLEKRVENEGVDALWKELLELDPGAEGVVQKENPRRIIRALEVCIKTGKPFSAGQKKGDSIFDALLIGIKTDRKKLYEKIDKRVDIMIKEGLVEETKKLIEKGYDWRLPSMSGIGYKEIGKYLEGEYSLDEAIQKIKYRTHQYARRQDTWFKRDKRIKWVESYKESEKLVREFLD